MTSDRFRQLALTLPEAVEAAHMNHPDFRVGGKIFATLMYPSRGATQIRLRKATVAAVREALEIAWVNTAPKRLVRRTKAD